jgi:hypothetical protein
MVETANDSRTVASKFLFKAVKAVLKGIIFYIVYLLISSILAPISNVVPGFQQMIETFATIYIILMILGELASGSIFHYFFNAAKALFIIGYMMSTLQGGIYSMAVENVKLMIDLRIFMMISIVLGLVGLAKTVLQAINYMSEKAEPKLI